MDPIVLSAIATAVASIAIAIATGVYTYFSKRLWEVTRDATALTRESLDIARQSVDVSKRAFEAANRPYVYVRAGRLGGSFSAESMTMTATLKNCGTFIATPVRVTWTVYSDGNSIHQYSVPSFLLEPQEHSEINTTVIGPYWPSISAGQITMEVDIDIRYDGITESEYYYREKYQWEKGGVSKRIKTEAN